MLLEIKRWWWKKNFTYIWRVFLKSSQWDMWFMHYFIMSLPYFEHGIILCWVIFEHCFILCWAIFEHCSFRVWCLQTKSDFPCDMLERYIHTFIMCRFWEGSWQVITFIKLDTTFSNSWALVQLVSPPLISARRRVRAAWVTYQYQKKKKSPFWNVSSQLLISPHQSILPIVFFPKMAGLSSAFNYVKGLLNR